MSLSEAMRSEDLALEFLRDPEGTIESAPLAEEHKQLLRDGDLAKIAEALADERDEVEGHPGFSRDSDPRPNWVLVGEVTQHGEPPKPNWVLVGKA